MQAYSVPIALALILLAYGIYLAARAISTNRAAGGAWFDIEGKQKKRQAHNLGLQAVVLLICGLLVLLWVALRLTETAVADASLPPEETPAAVSPTAPLPPTVGGTATPPSAPTPTPGDPVDGAATEDGELIVTIPPPFLASEAFVANTDGKGLWMRNAPFGDYMVLLPEDSVVYVRGGLIEVEGVLWQSVADPEGREGWVSADYLLYR